MAENLKEDYENLQEQYKEMKNEFKKKLRNHPYKMKRNIEIWGDFLEGLSETEFYEPNIKDNVTNCISKIYFDKHVERPEVNFDIKITIDGLWNINIKAVLYSWHEEADFKFDIVGPDGEIYINYDSNSSDEDIYSFYESSNKNVKNVCQKLDDIYSDHDKSKNAQNFLKNFIPTNFEDYRSRECSSIWFDILHDYQYLIF